MMKHYHFFSWRKNAKWRWTKCSTVKYKLLQINELNYRLEVKQEMNKQEEAVASKNGARKGRRSYSVGLDGLLHH